MDTISIQGICIVHWGIMQCPKAEWSSNANWECDKHIWNLVEKNETFSILNWYNWPTNDRLVDDGYIVVPTDYS